MYLAEQWTLLLLLKQLAASVSVGFEVITPVVMKSTIFWDTTPKINLSTLCSPSILSLVSYSAYPTSKMEAIYSSETSTDFQWATRRYIPEDSVAV
jgi:hypothetical protein